MTRSMFLALLLAYAPAPAAICTGMSRIETFAGETVKIEHGPDFDVYHVTGPIGDWSVYDGEFADVADGAPKRFLQRGDVAIMALSGHIGGYLAVEPKGEQNHFFGPIFKGGDGDRAFFDRVSFGATAKAACISATGVR